MVQAGPRCTPGACTARRRGAGSPRSQQRGEDHSPSGHQSFARTPQVPPNSITLSCSPAQQLDAPEMRTQRSGSKARAAGMRFWALLCLSPGRCHPAALRLSELTNTERTKASEKCPYRPTSKSLSTTLRCLFILVTLCLPFQNIGRFASWLRSSGGEPCSSLQAPRTAPAGADPPAARLCWRCRGVAIEHRSCQALIAGHRNPNWVTVRDISVGAR